MPKEYSYDRKLQDRTHLAMALLYVLGCLGFSETIVGLGLAICYYLLYRL